MAIKQERSQMGFTQEELALYLGLDRTQLTKTERGKRVIPYKSLDKWLLLRKCLEQEEGLKATTSKVLEQQGERLASFVKKQQCLLSCSAAMLELRLGRMETTYQGCIHALAFAAQLRQQHELKEEEELPIAHLEARSAKKMGSCGLDKQAALFIKLQAMKHMQQELAAFNNVFLHPKNRQL